MPQDKENKDIIKETTNEGKDIRVKLVKWGRDLDKIPDFRDVFRVAVEEDPVKQKRFEELKDLIPEGTSTSNIDADLFKKITDDDSVSGVSSDEDDLFKQMK